MDIGSAFTYVFDDEEWIKKLAIGGAIFLVGVLTIPILIGIVILFIPVGYMFQVLKNVRDENPNPLPEWTDFGNLLKVGFFVSLIGIIYNIPVYLFACAAPITQLLPEMVQMDSDAASAIALVAVCLNCVQMILSLLIAFILPGAIIKYAQYDNFGAAFKFGEIFSFIGGNIGDYIIAILLSWVASFIGVFGIILCFIGVFFTMFWSMLVTGNLYGQLARKAE